MRTGPVGGWVYDHRRVLRIGAVVLASLALVFWGQPTGKVIIGLALALLAVLAIVQFLARPPQHIHPLDLTGGRTPRRDRVAQT